MVVAEILICQFNWKSYWFHGGFRWFV